MCISACQLHEGLCHDWQQHLLLPPFCLRKEADTHVLLPGVPTANPLANFSGLTFIDTRERWVGTWRRDGRNVSSGNSGKSYSFVHNDLQIGTTEIILYLCILARRGTAFLQQRVLILITCLVGFIEFGVLCVMFSFSIMYLLLIFHFWLSSILESIAFPYHVFHLSMSAFSKSSFKSQS